MLKSLNGPFIGHPDGSKAMLPIGQNYRTDDRLLSQ